MKRSPAPLPRQREPSVAEALSRFPVVAITGARQTGRTTRVASGSIPEGRTCKSVDV